MAEIKCPNCGTVISLEQSDLDSIVKQVRDEEFARELAERVSLLESEKNQAVKLAQIEAENAAKGTLGAKESEITELKAQLGALEAQLKAQADAELANVRAEGATAVAQAKADAEAQMARLRAEHDATMAQERAQAEAQVKTLEERIGNREKGFAAEKELAVTQAVAAIEKERDQLKAAVDVKESEKVALESQMREKMSEQLEARDAIIKLREEELERLKDMRSRLSTKMLGESLEQHCQDEFNRIRATAFPKAYFEKDTESVGGTKGDFIFRECDDDGNEIVSIMFEMKNEGDTDSRKKRNEDHLAKLDKDRTKKDCEYAVLVSLLEPESELYNQGIVDVSYRFPKMYVIRPQFFIQIISLLRNAALNTLQYKREMALMRQQNLDVSTFEAEIEAFKTGFFRNYENASKRFEDAINDIDRTITLLEKIKDNLTKSGKHLTAANNKLDDLTVKKLTRKNPTVRAMFDALHEEDEEVPEEVSAEEPEKAPTEEPAKEPEKAPAKRRARSQRSAKKSSADA